MDKTINNKTFCIQPFINTTTRIKGNHNVCCNIHDEDSNIQHITASEFFNSAKVKKMRNDLLEGIILPDCKICHKMERINKLVLDKFIINITILKIIKLTNTTKI